MVCRSWRLLRLVAATLTCIAASSHAGAQGDLPRGGIAFVHVNVVPMDRERVLEDQTVLVEGDRIAAIGEDVPIPADAKIIDGQRIAYLSPGLADMHSHSDTRNDLAIYLASGVTTVLTMGGSRNAFVDWTIPAGSCRARGCRTHAIPGTFHCNANAWRVHCAHQARRYLWHNRRGQPGRSDSVDGQSSGKPCHAAHPDWCHGRTASGGMQRTFALSRMQSLRNIASRRRPPDRTLESVP